MKWMTEPRTCRICKQTKTKKDFYKISDLYWRTECIECYLEKDRKKKITKAA